MARRALVTGVTGCLGRALAARLVASGWSVKGLVRSTGGELSPQVEACIGDVTQPDSLRAAVAGCDTVFHCAAAVGDEANSARMRQINVDGTRALAEAARDAGVSRLVYASSVSVYGRKTGTYREETVLADAGHAYANSKREAEQILLDIGRDGGLAAVIVRPSTIYGPGDRHFVPTVIERLRKRSVVLIDGGRTPLNAVFVDDVAEIMHVAAERAAPGSIFNVTGPDRVSWCEFFERVARQLRLDAPTRKLSKRAAGRIAAVCEFLAAIHVLRKPPLTRFVVGIMTGDRTYPMDRAAAELDFRPRVSLDEGLARVLAEPKVDPRARDGRPRAEPAAPPSP